MNVEASKVYFDLGYFRLLHSAPNLPGVDIYINDKQVAEKLYFSSFTVYFPMVEDEYKVSLYKVGTDTFPLLTQTIRIAQNELYTLAIVSIQDNLTFFSIPDKNTVPVTGSSLLRFIQLSPNASVIDITLPDGTVLFSNIEYLDISQYIVASQTNYIFEARLAGTKNTILMLPALSLTPNDFFTIYILGLMNRSPDLESLQLLDGFK